MNVDYEDLVVFVHQNVNVVTTAMMANNIDDDDVERFANDMPDALIAFLLEDQESYTLRRTALEMQCNLIAAKIQHMWSIDRIPSVSTRRKNEIKEMCFEALRFTDIKSETQKHENRLKKV